MLKFSDHRDDALKIYGNAKQIINLENDYAFQPDSRLKKLHPEWQVWGTVPANVKAHGGAYVNWNVLTWLYPHPWAQPLKAYKPAPGRLLYYGAYRADRDESFRYWLDNDSYEVIIGARPKQKAKFAEAAPGATLINFRTPDELAQLRGTAIYMEDDTSHDLYCSLANRFFECLQLGIPILFDAKCIKTLQAAKLPQFHDYTVQNRAEAAELMKDPVKLAREQRALWHRDFDVILTKQLDKAVATL